MKTLSLAVAASLAATLPASADVFGHWLSEKSDEGKQIIVEVTPCGQSACGEIVWMSDPRNADGQLKSDINNKDEAMRSRTLCGAQMLGNFTRNGDKWEEGLIYAPDDGKTYKSNMSENADGTLNVRGYVDVFLMGSLIGRSQTWTRVEGNRGGC